MALLLLRQPSLKHFCLRATVLATKSSVLEPNAFQQLSMSGGGPFDEKRRGEENVRFRKEDERLLRQLLNKVKQQADSMDVHEAESTKSIELKALKEILGKYNISDKDLQLVLEWKHA